jgi:hypothetical protein
MAAYFTGFLDGELSSAGSEHLPYKQRVGGSNPSAPTQVIKQLREWLLFYFLIFEQQAGGKP